ncbi:MAG: hypothetical protein HYY44_03685, partial [Deltaproteobacteria bacterium]|nr:hypothetical protein [Deltaproteobacteria bacterium]
TAADSEYMRAFNVSGERMNLKGYKVRNGDFETVIQHDYILEAGQGVMILTHASKHPADRFDRSGRYKTAQYSWNDRAESFIDLRLDVDPKTNKRVRDETINYWDEDLPLELVAPGPDGKVLCMDVASQAAFKKLPDEFKRLRGVHF